MYQTNRINIWQKFKNNYKIRIGEVLQSKQNRNTNQYNGVNKNKKMNNLNLCGNNQVVIKWMIIKIYKLSN